MKAPPPARTRIGAAALLAAALLGGCRSAGTITVYNRPRTDLSSIRRVAILPLENLTATRFAEDKVRQILFTEVLVMGLFEAVDLAEVNRAVAAAGIQNVSLMGTEQMRQVGQAVKAEALVMGGVGEYGEKRAGNVTYPEVSLSLRLVDAEAGQVLWSVTGTRAGVGFWTRLVGVAEESQSDAAGRLVATMLSTLAP